MAKKKPGNPFSPARNYLEQMCQQFPEASNLGLAKKAKAERPSTFKNVEHARSMIRAIRGALGSRKNARATQPRPKGVAGQVPKMPPSLSTA